jgi:hypothetical protein
MSNDPAWNNQLEAKMPVTVSYDLTRATNNQRNYVRSMFERFGWRRLGGSVFRYGGRKIEGVLQEDWLNDVAPALMFFRSYVLGNSIQVKSFTLDAMSVSRVDYSIAPHFGRRPRKGAALSLKKPTNVQSSEKTLRDFVDAAIAAT